MAKKPIPQERLIHIKAVSKCYSANIIVPEKYAVGVLENMREGFAGLRKREAGDVLRVQTCVHNPTLF
jgi:hypothetical protein